MVKDTLKPPSCILKTILAQPRKRKQNYDRYTLPNSPFLYFFVAPKFRKFVFS